MALLFTIEASYGIISINPFYKGVLITIGMGFFTLGWGGLYRAIGYEKISIMNERNRIIFIFSNMLGGSVLLLVLMNIMPNGISVHGNPWAYLLVNISLASIFMAIGFAVVYFLEKYYRTDFDQLQNYIDSLQKYVDQAKRDFEQVKKSLDESSFNLQELLKQKEQIDATSNEFTRRVEETKKEYAKWNEEDSKVVRIAKVVAKADFVVSLLLTMIGIVFGSFITLIITLVMNAK